MKLLHNAQSLGFKIIETFDFFFHISSDVWKEVKVQFNPRGSEFIELIFFCCFLVLAKRIETELNIIMKKIKTGGEKAEGGT